MKLKRFLYVVMIIMMLLNSFTAYADSNVSFQFVESTPANLYEAVDLNPEIKLLFNKNVVNFSVKDNNATCIKMFDENGQAVNIDIIFPDDQIEPEKKREIYIKPILELDEDTEYTIELSAQMLAKNGSTLGDDVLISFTTLSLTDNQADVSEEISNQDTEIISGSEQNVQDNPVIDEEIKEENSSEALITEDNTEVNEETPVDKKEITEIHAPEQKIDETEVNIEKEENEKVEESEKDVIEKDSNDESIPVSNVEVTEQDYGANYLLIGMSAIIIIAAAIFIKVKQSRK